MESGITVLQRQGAGIAIGALSMVVAGLVERIRRNSAVAHGGSSPLSAAWLLPQLVLMGIAEAFNAVGQVEFYNLCSSANYSTVNGLLDAANSLLLKFRHSTNTSALCLNLKYCLDGFTAQFISANATASSPDVLCPFSMRIFHSLNSTELPKFFEDPMREWNLVPKVPHHHQLTSHRDRGYHQCPPYRHL